MRVRNPFVQGVLLVAAAFVIAVVSNAMASRERRLVLPGWYPNAQRVPPREPEVVAPPAITETAVAPVAADSTGSPPPVPDAVPAAAGKLAAPAPSAPAKAAAEPVANPLARFVPHPDKAFVEIGGADAALLHANGALFLDARRTSVYDEGHVADARNFSVWEADIDARVSALFGERSDPEKQNLPIVIYCSGGECEDSHMLAQKLWGVQFNNVYVYKDGFPDWQKRGGAVRKGGRS